MFKYVIVDVSGLSVYLYDYTPETEDTLASWGRERLFFYDPDSPIGAVEFEIKDEAFIDTFLDIYADQIYNEAAKVEQQEWRWDHV